MQTPTQILLVLDSIEHRYGERILFRDLSLHVRQGELLCLLGESGSGKSTLLRLIAGLEAPTRGEITLMGRSARRIPPHQRGMAWVSQSAGCYDHLTVKENLALAEQLATASQGTPSMQSAAEWRSELIETLQLGGSMEQRPAQLSGGQVQRLAIARAFLTQRPILLMDEPLVHLHESLRQPIRATLRQWQQRLGCTCIYITHDSAEACQIADRVAVLANGGIAQVEPPELMYCNPRNHWVAELMGTPTVQWFTPSDLGETPVSQSERPQSERLGVRPREWRWLSMLEPSERLGPRPVHDPVALRVAGRILQLRSIESEVWISIDIGAREPLCVVWPRFSACSTSIDASREGGLLRAAPSIPDGLRLGDLLLLENRNRYRWE
jgi:ABC-type sugar transport system ATPase subunit